MGSPAGGEPWSIRSDHTPGDLGFDPPNLKPTDPEELKVMQTKELNNGRLAMIAAAGMIAQELATGSKLFELKGGATQQAFDVRSMAGITEPVGFFDPLGFAADASEGKIRFYREVELKHGRVAMLAALGFLVGENFHPLFGGDIDAPAYLAFQQTPLETWWGLVVLAISIPEIYSVFTFNTPLGGEPWSIRSDHSPGDFGFDPMDLKPTDPEELKVMQT